MQSGVLLAAIVLTLWGTAWGQEQTKIKFKPPQMGGEEDNPFMPDQLKCDACRVISYQLYQKFKKYNKPRKSQNYEIKESDLLDLTESLCEDNDLWNRYALKEVDGVNRLSGEGLETKDSAGMLAGGGKWPSRLMDMCESFMGDLGEFTIYNVYKAHPKSKNKLESYLCRGEGLTGYCNKFPVPESSKKDNKDEL